MPVKWRCQAARGTSKIAVTPCEGGARSTCPCHPDACLLPPCWRLLLYLARCSPSRSRPPSTAPSRRTRCRSSAAAIEGFNIDLANEIGKRLKRPVTIDATQFSGIVPALQAGTYDFVAAPTTVTKERADNMLFTEGYLNTDFQFLIKKGAPEGHRSSKISRARSSRSTRARPTTTGRAISKPRSAGRSRASARRPTPCRPCSPAAPTPTSPATP